MISPSKDVLPEGDSGSHAETLQISPSTPIPVIHLRFLDGLRGLAALYVVFSHLRVSQAHGLIEELTAWTHFGHAAVAVFIVLSGYCLMLPVARSSNGELRGGIGRYLTRRAMRILPPYYAALLISIPIEFLHQRNHHHSIDKGALISHIFLVHNLNAAWSQALDIPMWSVATEWQIYFFLPLVLLPIWRKFGIGASVSVAFLLGMLPHFALPSSNNFDWACPWYLGLFSLGTMGALLHERTATFAKGITDLTPGAWFAIAGLLFCAGIGCHLALISSGDQFDWLIDTILGFSAVSLIAGCAIQCRNATPHSSVILRLLESKTAVKLGEFSYSLYLIHTLVYYTLGWVLMNHIHNPNIQQIALFVIIFPAMLLCGYGFYLLFERPLTIKRERI